MNLFKKIFAIIALTLSLNIHATFIKELYSIARKHPYIAAVSAYFVYCAVADYLSDDSSDEDYDLYSYTPYTEYRSSRNPPPQRDVPIARYTDELSGECNCDEDITTHGERRVHWGPSEIQEFYSEDISKTISDLEQSAPTDHNENSSPKPILKKHSASSPKPILKKHSAYSDS